MSSAQQTESLREWMYNFLVDHTGDVTAFYNILERSSLAWDETAPLSSAEQDRAEIFQELVGSLTSILGSEEAAGKWLMYSSTFKAAGGSSPLSFLEEGGFWTLSLLQEMLAIAQAYPTDPLGLRSEASVAPKASVATAENQSDLEPARLRIRGQQSLTLSDRPVFVIEAWHAVREVDIWAAAWGLSDNEIEPALKTPLGSLSAWRRSEPLGWNEDQPLHLVQLRRLQYALWCWLPHDHWKGFWRRPWLDGGSPVEMIAAEGPGGVDRLADFLESAARS